MMIDGSIRASLGSLAASSASASANAVSRSVDAKPLAASAPSQFIDPTGQAAGVAPSMPVLAGAALSALQEIDPVAPVRRDDGGVFAQGANAYQQAADAYGGMSEAAFGQGLEGASDFSLDGAPGSVASSLSGGISFEV